MMPNFSYVHSFTKLLSSAYFLQAIFHYTSILENNNFFTHLLQFTININFIFIYSCDLNLQILYKFNKLKELVFDVYVAKLLY